MTAEERRSVDDKLDIILTRVGRLETRMSRVEQKLAALRGELDADISLTDIAVCSVGVGVYLAILWFYGGAIGVALARLYGVA